MSCADVTTHRRVLNSISKGKGNKLFDLLVSSSSLESAHFYKQATKVLGHFSGYVYSAAVGNLLVCPPDLNRVSDLFL